MSLTTKYLSVLRQKVCQAAKNYNDDKEYIISLYLTSLLTGIIYLGVDICLIDIYYPRVLFIVNGLIGIYSVLSLFYGETTLLFESYGKAFRYDLLLSTPRKVLSETHPRIIIGFISTALVVCSWLTLFANCTLYYSTEQILGDNTLFLVCDVMVFVPSLILISVFGNMDMYVDFKIPEKANKIDFVSIEA